MATAKTIFKFLLYQEVNMDWRGIFGIGNVVSVDQPQDDEESSITVHKVRFDPSSETQERTEEVAREVERTVKDKDVPASPAVSTRKLKGTLRKEQKILNSAEQKLRDIFSKNEKAFPSEEKQAILEYCSAQFDLLFFPKHEVIGAKKTKSEKRKSRSEPLKSNLSFSFATNEGEVKKLQDAKSQLDKKFDDFKMGVESYRDNVTKCRREFRDATLPETKLAKKTEALTALWNYRTFYHQYSEEILVLDDHAKKIENTKNSFNLEVEGLIEELTLLESSLMEHFQKIQMELREIENAINPEKDPLAEVVNIPSEKSEFPFLIKVEEESPSEFLAKKILEGSSSNNNLYGALLTLQQLYHASDDIWLNQIDNFLASLFKAAAMKKTKDHSLIYDETNFSNLFHTAKELGFEGSHLVSKLSHYVGSISGKRGQLTPQNKDRPAIIFEAEKLKPIYKDLFKEGSKLIKKIHDRKAELEALKAKINMKLDVSKEDLESRKEVLLHLFTEVCENNQKTMDPIKSGRATASTYFWGSRFHHPANMAAEGPWEVWYWNFFKENGFVEKEVQDAEKAQEEKAV